MILYLVCCSDAAGFADAKKRGWTRLARNRYATAEKDDVRVVRRFAEMIPLPGRTMLIKGADFPEEPAEGSQAALFAEFVAAGHGEWIGDASDA